MNQNANVPLVRNRMPAWRRPPSSFWTRVLVVIAVCWGGVAVSLAGVVRGTVEGPRGVIGGAEVVLLQEGRSLRTVSTDGEGRFVLEVVPAGSYQIQVVVPLYMPVVQGFEVPAGGQEIELRVQVSSLNETVTVTATRLPVPVAASVSDVKLLTAEDLREMPYQALDDGLRSLPEFSLFRRSSSLVAHPTTQGVSLRGIGPSGVSRSLVLADGIPLNDAFGGWVYWDRIPALSLQQVEVANGSGSSLYGNYALGGVVQLLKRVPQPATLELLGQGGDHGSFKGDVYGSHRIGPWGFSLSGSFFDYDGYPLVRESQRGAVDIAAFSGHQAVRFQTEWAPGDRAWIASLEGGFLNERRGNGTPQQNNDTDLFDFSAGAQWSPRAQDRVEARAFFRRNIFVSTFTAVAANRNSENLTTQQHNPAADGGASLLWFHTQPRHSFVTGSDVWVVSGKSTDNVFTGTPPQFTRVRLGGGKQATTGWFAEGSFSLSPQATLVLGGRLDVWKNFDGFQGDFPLTDRQVASVRSRTAVEFGPRVGLTVQLSAPLTLHASAYRAFRAPTLNELYRAFRAGAITTSANSALVPEHNVGGELGARYRVADQLSAGLSWFINVLDKPVSNVTVGPNLRQRQNLGRVRILGLQSSLNWRPVSAVEMDLMYLWDRTRVTEFAVDPALVDKRLPQVAVHRLTLKAALSLPQSFRLVLTGRYGGDQFDDDLNQVLLPDYFAWDAHVSRSLGQWVRLFLALENLTDAGIVTGCTAQCGTPSHVDLLGTPFQVRGGIYLSLSHR